MDEFFPNQWTRYMLRRVWDVIFDQRRRGWSQSPVLSRCWRLEEYLYKRLRRKPT